MLTKRVNITALYIYLKNNSQQEDLEDPDDTSNGSVIDQYLSVPGNQSEVRVGYGALDLRNGSEIDSELSGIL